MRNKKRYCAHNSFFSCVLNKDMTGLVIPYQVPGPFDGLANWSKNFPFKAQDVEYPSVDHYVYCALTRQEHNAQLLSSGDNFVLRQRFNSISNAMHITAMRDIAVKGVERQKIMNPDVRRFFQDYPSFYFYYISNDIHLGINEKGFGFNLIGQAFSQSKSPVFPVNETYVYIIYKASVLMTNYIQQDAGDVREFIGVSVNEIVDKLSAFYPSLIYVSSVEVFKTFQKDPYYSYIQYELDYPMNLAGFIRQTYIHQLNYYMRTKFNRIMIHHYFEHLLKKKYDKVIDTSQMDYYIRQEIAKLGVERFHSLSNRLFEIYNDPDTNKKTHAFLTSNVREELYNIEIQFLSKTEIMDGEIYIPFLFQVRTNRSLYIYDQDFGEEPIKPFTRYISPFSTVVSFGEYRSLAEYIYTNYCEYMTRNNLDQIKREFINCVDLISFQEKLHTIVNNHKLSLMKKGMNLKFSSNRFARYLLNDTQKYMFNINITDPDLVFNDHMTRHLLNIRKELKAPIYSILYSLVENIYLQDRVRFRIDDFLFTYDLYRKYLNQPLTTMKDMVYLQEYIFRDPFFHSTTTKPVHPVFFMYFSNICEKPVITKLWNGMVGFVDILQKNIENLSSTNKMNLGITVASVVPIVCSMVNHFYNPEDEPTRFYNFVTSLLIGKPKEFQQSITYYTPILEDEFKKYLPLDDYDTLFVVNLFGVCTQIQQNIDATRFSYFSFLAMKPASVSYPSSLIDRIDKYIYVDLPKKTVKTKKSIAELKKVFEKTTVVANQEEEEEEENLAEMMKELGLEDDEEENEEEEDEEISFNDDLD
jgi:hypothetical protein